MSVLLMALVACMVQSANGAPSPHAAPLPLIDQLRGLKSQVSTLEQNLLDGQKSQVDTRTQVRKIKKLLKLQQLEKKLGEQRLKEIEDTVHELENRRIGLNEKLTEQERRLHGFLRAIESSARGPGFRKLEQERIGAPTRYVLSRLVEQGIKEVSNLKAELADASGLQKKIYEEREQLAYLFQDLKEQAGVLELNRQLQLDFLKREQNKRVSQLQNYRHLKSAEAQVEHLIGQFDARRELHEGEFSSLKGKLPYPVDHRKVIGTFGRSFDEKSGLYVFKKGIDLATTFGEPVRAVYRGKIAYSGKLPGYGRVVILDHGGHFYSLCGRLGRIDKKVDDWIQAGEVIGSTGDPSSPLYFEIRSKNVAVNPLQWLFN